MKKEPRAVSNAVFAGVVIVLVIIAAVGFALYATKPSTAPSTVTTPPSTTTLTYTQTSTQTMTSTQTATVTQTSTQTVTSTQVITRPVTVNASGAFYNGKVITFLYTSQFMCTPESVRNVIM